MKRRQCHRHLNQPHQHHGRKNGHRKNTIGREGVGRHLSKYKPTTVTGRVESFDINTLTS